MTEFRPSSFQVLPLVVKNLLIINLLFFLAQLTFSNGGIIQLENVLGLHNVKSPLFEPWQLVSYLFLHGDRWHLISNMFAFWMFGATLENMWGPKRFLTFYFLCGIGAGLIQLGSLWFQYKDLIDAYLVVKNHPTPDSLMSFYQSTGLLRDAKAVNYLQQYLSDPTLGSNISGVLSYITEVTNRAISYPTIGASGAVFGILAAFIYLFPNHNIYVLIPIPAKYFGLFYFGSELFSAYQNNPTDNIAHWAHLGGGLVGFLLILTWNKTNRRHFY